MNIEYQRCHDVIESIRMTNGEWQHVCDRFCPFHVPEYLPEPQESLSIEGAQEAMVVKDVWIRRRDKGVEGWETFVDIGIVSFNMGNHDRYALHMVKQKEYQGSDPHPKDVKDLEGQLRKNQEKQLREMQIKGLHKALKG